MRISLARDHRVAHYPLVLASRAEELFLSEDLPSAKDGASALARIPTPRKRLPPTDPVPAPRQGSSYI